MDHFYIKNKVPPSRPSNDSPKVFVLAFGAILLISCSFLLKSFFESKKADEQLSAGQDQEVEKIQDISVPLISAEEVQKCILTKECQLIDIRERDLFEAKHIESSENFPISQYPDLEVQAQKNKKIVIIDSITDPRSKALSQKLISEGFNAFYLDGGIEKYILDGLAVVSQGDPDSIYDQSKSTPLSATQLKQRLQKGEKFVFIDVRSPEQYKAEHIQDSVNIPLEEIEKSKSKIPIGKLILCDEVPTRSFQAAVVLYDMNYWGTFFLSDSLSTLKEELAKTE